MTDHPALKILIVEDEALLAMDIEAMVDDAGHHVVAEAASVREVEALEKPLDPDVAFVDVHLAEGSSGIDACRFIRKRWPDAVIIFLTANPMKVPADYAGAHGVISKPFSRNGLMSAMHYIEQGIVSPPPSLPQPSSFTPSPALASMWG
jgi:CheY-like chemotaxis protein